MARTVSSFFKEPGILSAPAVFNQAPPRRFDQLLQDIASAAHLRGVILTRGINADGSPHIVGAVEARELCRTIRAAAENTRGQDGRHTQVKQAVFAIAMKLGQKGAVQVPRMTMNVLMGYAKPRQIEGARRARSDSAVGASQRDVPGAH